MVVFLLCVKAELENVEEIVPEEHMRFCLDVRARPRPPPPCNALAYAPWAEARAAAPAARAARS
jgi:hypothetical protein